MTGKKLTIVLLVLILTVVGFQIYSHSTTPKTAYILIDELYAKFEMKKEMEKKFNETKNQRQRILDSLAIELRVMANKLAAEKVKDIKEVEVYNFKREEFYQKQHTFDEDNKQLSNKYDEEILSQLNQYVKDYGKKNDFAYIFGNGNGSLMFAVDDKNITPQVSEYINKRYSGKE